MKEHENLMRLVESLEDNLGYKIFNNFNSNYFNKHKKEMDFHNYQQWYDKKEKVLDRYTSIMIIRFNGKEY